MSIRQFWHRFRRLPRDRRALIFEAAIWLVLARMVIRFVPFSWIGHRIGRLHPPGGGAPNQFRNSAPADGPVVARSISWAINRAALVLPLRLVCLPRALAAWQMLRRRGISGRVHFGASRRPSQEPRNNHAWVDACGIEVTGYPEAHNCVEIGFFVR